MTQGQAAFAGNPVNGSMARPISAAPIDIRMVVASGSSPRLTAAFQPAWHSAANSTATKTKESMKDAFPAAAGYSGSVAIDRRDFRLRRLRLNGDFRLRQELPVPF